MKRLLTAALAAITLLGAAGAATVATAEGEPGKGRGSERSAERGAERRDNVVYNEDGNRYHDKGKGRDGHWDRGTRAWRTHAARCERAYRSYSRRTDTYRTFSGNRRRCRL